MKAGEGESDIDLLVTWGDRGLVVLALSAGGARTPLLSLDLDRDLTMYDTPPFSVLRKLLLRPRLAPPSLRARPKFCVAGGVDPSGEEIRGACAPAGTVLECARRW